MNSHIFSKVLSCELSSMNKISEFKLANLHLLNNELKLATYLNKKNKHGHYSMQ